MYDHTDFDWASEVRLGYSEDEANNKFTGSFRNVYILSPNHPKLEHFMKKSV